jgi:hypothetical protein
VDHEEGAAGTARPHRDDQAGGVFFHTDERAVRRHGRLHCGYLGRSRGERGTSVLDEQRELADRGRFEQRRERQPNLELAVDARHQPDRDQRVPTELEEVVVDRRRHAEQIRPHRRQLGDDFALGIGGGRGTRLVGERLGSHQRRDVDARDEQMRLSRAQRVVEHDDAFVRPDAECVAQLEQ